MTDRTDRPRLVTLRTAPMPDPGEWCQTVDGSGWSYCQYFTDGAEDPCMLGHQCAPVHDDSDHYRRPQSCRDGAEEVSS